MYWNRMDIVEAYYAFLCDNHEGQWSRKYARLCRISRYFKPSPLWKGYRSLSENGKAIYDRLEADLPRNNPESFQQAYMYGLEGM